jgi:NAD(P)-dependent dehydrogenase (short-subunit alcohol dehydrogenase family)
VSGLDGRRLLVVGASSGIGAAFARAASGAGARVAVSARRADALTALVEAMGAGVAVPGDVTVPAEVRDVVETTVEALGGLDLVLYAAGSGVLGRIEELDPEVWVALFRLNVIGASLVTRETLPHLAPDGVVAYLSSRTVEDANALFAAYHVTKAALDQTIRAWRVEHPRRRFVRVVMGNTQPTGFAQHMGDELMHEAIESWAAQALPGGLMHTDDVGSALASALGVVLDHPEIDSSELKLDARRLD